MRKVIDTTVVFKVKDSTSCEENIFVCGSIPLLGNWKVENALALQTDSDDFPYWCVSVQVPQDTMFAYKYFKKRGDLIQWEDLEGIRELTATGKGVCVSDNPWGETPDGECGIISDKGWLEKETQIRIFLGIASGDSFPGVTLWQPQPYKMTVKSQNKLVVDNIKFCTVGTLQADHSFVFQAPSRDMVSFAILLRGLDNQLIGKCFFDSKELGIRGEVKRAILNRELEPVGFVQLMYIFVTPFKLSPNFPQESSRPNLPFYVGHRGLGATPKTSEGARGLLIENTMMSFLTAAHMGARLIEFDVQLTRDDVPIIAHDEEIWVRTTGIDSEVKLKVPICKIKLSKVKKLEPMVVKEDPASNAWDKLRSYVFSKKRNVTSSSSLTHNTPRSLWGKLSMYPTLQETFQLVPLEVGFNVEIKYPEPEMEEYFGVKERNFFVDRILEVIYQHANDRMIIISSFDPDICLLASLKQIRYPVLFLTEGGTKKSSDPRRNSVEMALNFAKASSLCGVVSESTPILENLDLVRQAHESGLLLLTFGKQNNDPEKVRIQQQAGVDSVIGDKVFHMERPVIESAAKRLFDARVEK